MDNKLNVQKLGYEVGEPMWVHWDNRYVLRGGRYSQSKRYNTHTNELSS